MVILTLIIGFPGWPADWQASRLAGCGIAGAEMFSKQ